GGGDVLTTLMWGLRRYAWVVVLFVVGIGILVPVLQSRAADVYEGQAQVGPTEQIKLPNLNSLPRLGDAVFSNGAVADAVRVYLKLPSGAAVVPNRVQVVAAQDNLVFIVIGRGPDLESATNLANVAAAAFTLELNKYSATVSPFAIQHGAYAAPKPVSTRGGYLSIALGLLAGVIAGVGVVALLLVVRRPVVDASTAEGTSGAPVLGRMRLPRGGGEIDERDVMGIALLCRRVLSNSPGAILLASPPAAVVQLRQLGSAMDAFLDRVHGLATKPEDQEASPEADSPSGQPGSPREPRMRPELLVLDGPSLEQWARHPDEAELTLLMVPEGIGARSLRNASDAYFTGGPAGLVIVAEHGSRRGRWRKTRPAATKQSEPEPAEKTAKKDGHGPKERSPEKGVSPLR
ncbi:MAG: hypothetical protein ABJA81_02285, partial [Nocardioidaceae bacterium]